MPRWLILIAALLGSALSFQDDPVRRLRPAPPGPSRPVLAPAAQPVLAERPREERAFARGRDDFGIERAFRRGVILAKRRGGRVEEWAVPRGQELASLRAIRADPAVEFAELDFVLTRQFAPSDPQGTSQWHHATIGSSQAWDISVGYSAARTPLVQLAILDTPFQMNHPDLAAHTSLGWSLIAGRPNELDTNGYYHSTIAAGLAGAIINNGLGVSGVVNCQLVPVDIGNLPTTRDMHDAVVWAADQGIRVVSLSWDGAFSAVINDAGAQLKQKARGMLFMAGVNGARPLVYPAWPHIYAVSMTDSNDLARSAWGDHIDFAAPGWNIYSTTTNSSYEADSGTSFSAPLAAGVAAWIMSENEALGPDDVEGILRASCVDLGAPGWDQRYGWGRIHFGRAARLAFESSPASRVSAGPQGVETEHRPGHEYRLLHASDPGGPWSALAGVPTRLAEGKIAFQPDPSGPAAFYRVERVPPR